MVKRKLVIILILNMAVIMIAGAFFFKIYVYNLMLYKNTVKQSNYIRHALGGLDTYQYLNTIEALENSYKKGFRLFEVDVRFTSDDKLVLTHGWEEVDYIERMGISYDEQNSIPTYKEFMNYKIQGRYSATSFNDFVKKKLQKKMKESNLISYVFTSDNKEVKKIFDMGANIVCTNFLE